MWMAIMILSIEKTKNLMRVPYVNFINRRVYNIATKKFQKPTSIISLMTFFIRFIYIYIYLLSQSKSLFLFSLQ